MSLAPVKHIEEALVRKISMSDQKAFKALFHLYYRRLCRFAFLFTQSKEQSDEAVLDVFLSLWIRREQLVPVQNIRSFLYAAVRNQAIKHSQRANPIYSRNYMDVYELEMESPEPSADEDMDRELFRERLQKAYRKLPEQCRLIARMHFTDQLQFNEIAEILHISHKTVRAQVANATQKIKEIFVKYGWNK